MSTVTELTQTAQEQTLAAVRQSQQFVVDATRTWAEAVEKALQVVGHLLERNHHAGERDEQKDGGRVKAENVVQVEVDALPRGAGR